MKTFDRYISAILFDLYGTLADVEVDEKSLRFWQRLIEKTVLATSGVTARELRTCYLELAEKISSIHGEGFVLQELFPLLLKWARVDPTDDDTNAFIRTFRQLSIKSLTLRGYTVPLLTTIRGAGLRIAVVSNTEAVLTKYDIERLELSRYVDRVVLSSDVQAAKPDMAIFRVALATLQIDARGTLFVGDSWETDIVGARNAGLAAIFVTSDSTIHSSSDEGIVVAPPTLRGILDAIRKCGADVPRRG